MQGETLGQSFRQIRGGAVAHGDLIIESRPNLPCGAESPVNHRCVGVGIHGQRQGSGAIATCVGRGEPNNINAQRGRRAADDPGGGVEGKPSRQPRSRKGSG